MPKEQQAPNKIILDNERRIILRQCVHELEKSSQLETLTLSDFEAMLFETIGKSLKQWFYCVFFGFLIVVSPLALLWRKNNKLEQAISVVGQRMSAHTRLVHLRVDETGAVHKKLDFLT